MTRLSDMLRHPETLALAWAVLLVGIGMALSVPFIPMFFVNELHLTPLHLGVFLTMNALSTVFISAWLARRSDRTDNRKPNVLLALSAAGCGLLMLGSLRFYPLILLLGAVFFGAGGASLPQLLGFGRARFAHAPGDLPERTVTMLRSAFSLAWVIGPNLGSFLLGEYGFSRLFLIGAGLTFLALPALWFVQGSTAPAPAAAESALTATPGRVRRPMRWVILAFVLYGMSLSMSSSMYPLLVTKTIHGTNDQVGLLIGFTALMEIPFMFALVMLRRMPSVEKLIVWGMLLYALYFVVVIAAQGIPLLMAAQIIRSAVIAILAGLGLTYFQQLMPGQYAVATALFMNTTNIGGVVSGVVAGAWAEAFGYREVFMLCAALILCAWGVMLWVTRRETLTGGGGSSLVSHQRSRP